MFFEPVLLNRLARCVLEVEAAARQTNFNFSGVYKPQTANGQYGLRYAEFTVPLVKAVQEQQAMIQILQNQLAELKARLNQLEKK